MKALTLWQPWASLISHDDKRIENRTWPPPKWIIGQRIAIHAGKKAEYNSAVLRLPRDFKMPLGAIVATAVVKGFVTESKDRWFAGPFGWLLDDVKTLSEPIPFRGAQGLWDVPEEISMKLGDAA